MRVTLIQDCSFNQGGAFHQEVAAIEAIVRHCESRHEFIVLTTKRENVERLSARGITAQALDYGPFARIFDGLCAQSLALDSVFRRVRRVTGSAIGRGIDRLLEKFRTELVIFGYPSDMARLIVNHNYFYSPMDCCHRDWLEFPEQYNDRIFERRDRLYRAILPKAVRVIVDSATMADRIHFLYQVDLTRIVALPYFAPLAVQQGTPDDQDFPGHNGQHSGIPKPYLFYPAQFWPHKNHAYILEALKILRDRDKVVVHAAFAGSDKGNQRFLEGLTRSMALQEQVHFLGFVFDQEISELYRQALALVMPTYFGPSNIPPFEAFALGCPVIYSDFPCFREQCGEAALYCDLGNPASLADHLLLLLKSPEASRTLKQLGRDQVPRNLAHRYGEVFSALLDDYETMIRAYRAW